MSDNITIAKSRYLELRKAEAELNRLEAAGVDNWEGRDYAYEGWNKEVEELEQEILGYNQS